MKTAFQMRAEIAKVLPKCHYVAVALFLAGLLLWLIEPCPVNYLLTFSLLGICWFGAVIWMWRMWHMSRTSLPCLLLHFTKCLSEFLTCPLRCRSFKALF